MIYLKSCSSSTLTMLTSSALVLILYLGCASSSSLETARKDTLQLVQVLFRHGDRAPTNTYPLDPFNGIPGIWPEGMAQLTNRGKMQQYELGQYLRHRYDGFLGKKYSQKELYVTSSDMDRTIMSLESNLAGLFPPVNHWNPEIEWQPIPLRTIPWKEDKLLHNNVRCPRYRELRTEFLSSSEVVLKMNEENEEFIRYCAENSGLPARTVKQLYPLLDVLYAQSAHNFTLPKWVREGNVLSKIIKLHSYVNTWPTYTDEMKRLWGGNLLNLLLKNMIAIAGHLAGSNNPEAVHSVSHGVNRKMIMYSAHDSTLSRIMNTMGIFEPQCPPYASALLVELHQDPETLEYYVEYHYRNDTTRAPYLLTPVKCGNPCKLRKLIEIYNPLIPVDWAKECRQESGKPANFFTLKMHEHDHEDDDDSTEGDEIHGATGGEGHIGSNEKFDWSQPESCYPTTLQLALMGIGLFASSALAAFVIVKVLQSRKGNLYDQIDYSARPILVHQQPQHKPYFYGGAAGYEKL